PLRRRPSGPLGTAAAHRRELRGAAKLSQVSGVTSVRAKWCLGIVVAGYLATAVVAGAPRSPLSVPLPAGARPPSWAAAFAKAVGLNQVGRSGLIGVSWIL